MSLVPKTEERNTKKARELERVSEKKNVTFFFAQATNKEDKLVEFSWRIFECYNKKMLQCSEKNLTTGFCSEIVFYS